MPAHLQYHCGSCENVQSPIACLKLRELLISRVPTSHHPVCASCSVFITLGRSLYHGASFPHKLAHLHGEDWALSEVHRCLTDSP